MKEMQQESKKDQQTVVRWCMEVIRLDWGKVRRDSERVRKKLRTVVGRMW